MKLQLERLDGRHNASRVYTHRVWIYGSDFDSKKNYIDLREWCWETFGPGCERDLIWYNKSSSYRWAFHHSQKSDSMYIYLKEEVLTTFMLKWIN
jgi:hypothetical protein